MPRTIQTFGNMKITMKAIAALMLSMAMVFAVGCKPDNEPNNDSNNLPGNEPSDVPTNENGHGVYNGNYEYVDLGLPSGTLWATFNVGAGSPEGVGDQFAWGETEPKENYCWETYKYFGGYRHVVITKYNDSDGLINLEPSDDAATVKWGTEWCTPTSNQFYELFSNTTGTMTSQNGRNGRLFTASNGNSIFLPTNDTVEYSSGPCEVGLYWGRGIVVDPYKEMASDLVFEWDNGYCGTDSDWDYRYCGHSIRPVRSSR